MQYHVIWSAIIDCQPRSSALSDLTWPWMTFSDLAKVMEKSEVINLVIIQVSSTKYLVFSRYSFVIKPESHISLKNGRRLYLLFYFFIYFFVPSIRSWLLWHCHRCASSGCCAYMRLGMVRAGLRLYWPGFEPEIFGARVHDSTDCATSSPRCIMW